MSSAHVGHVDHHDTDPVNK